MRVVLLAVLSAQAQTPLPGLPSQKVAPDSVRKLIEKRDAGSELTDAEAKEVDDWEDQRAKELEAAWLKSAPSPRKSSGADTKGARIPPPLNRPAFLELLGVLRRDYAKRAGPGLLTLDKALMASKSGNAGANVAMALSLAGAAPAAVHATLWSCGRNPDDPTFVSNLGALLEGLEDERALTVLSYAVSLAPEGVLANTNLGWCLFNRGQFATAKGAFDTAAKAAPDAGPALLGQGMVAHRQGDHRKAIQYLSRALSIASSASGEEALDESQGETSETVPSSPGEVPLPKREDWTKGAPEPNVVIIDPVVSGSNQELYEVGAAKNAGIIKGYNERAQALIARQQGLRPNDGRDRSPVRTSTSLTLFRGDDAMAALARAQYTAFEVKRRAVRSPFERGFDEQRERVNVKVQDFQREALAGPPERYLEALCRKLRPAMEVEYGAFKASWGGAWEVEQRTIRDYGREAAATLSRIRHDDLREYLDIERRLHLLSMAMDGPADLIGWNSLGAAVMACDPKVSEPETSSVEASDDAKKTPCPPFLQGGFGVDLGVASVTLDCEKIAFQAGEGVIGRFEQNYVKHEQTYFLGVGVDSKVGVGAASAGVEGTSGVFVTCSGNTVRDIGLQSSRSVAFGTLKGEVSGTVGLVSGPSYSTSGTLGIGPVTVGIPGGH